MGLDITGVGAVSDLANTVINKIWPDKTDQEKQQLAAAVMVVQGQIDINKNEASNPSLLVSGWRPFIGWTCGVAFGYATILEPLLRVGSAVWFGYAGAFPVIDTTLTMQALFGILGLGAMRSFDKKAGTSK